MSANNEFSVQMNKDDAEMLLAGIARLSGGLCNMFGDSADDLARERRDGEIYGPAKEWIIENYNVAGGANSLICSVSDLLLRVFQDKDITISD